MRADRSRAPDEVFQGDPELAAAALARFVRPGCPHRLFEYQGPSGCLCFYEYHRPRGMAYASARYSLLSLAYAQPFSAPKRLALRLFGAAIHPTAYLSPQVFVDPLFASLLTVEQGVLVGVGVRIALHEHSGTRFRAGRVTIRRGATIGADARLACGVEIGEEAVVGLGAVVLRDVPPRAVVIGNPARVVSQGAPDGKRSCTSP